MSQLKKRLKPSTLVQIGYDESRRLYLQKPHLTDRDVAFLDSIVYSLEVNPPTFLETLMPLLNSARLSEIANQVQVILRQ